MHVEINSECAQGNASPRYRLGLSCSRARLNSPHRLPPSTSALTELEEASCGTTGCFSCVVSFTYQTHNFSLLAEFPLSWIDELQGFARLGLPYPDRARSTKIQRQAWHGVPPLSSVICTSISLKSANKYVRCGFSGQYADHAITKAAGRYMTYIPWHLFAGIVPRGSKIGRPQRQSVSQSRDQEQGPYLLDPRRQLNKCGDGMHRPPPEATALTCLHVVPSLL